MVLIGAAQRTEDWRYKHPVKKRLYPSVTNVISAAWPNDALNDWRTKNIAKNVVANIDDLLPKLKRIAKREPKLREMSYEGLGKQFLEWRHDNSAAERGTRIHKGLELLLSGQKTAKKLRKKMAADEYTQVIAAATALDDIQFKPWYIEAPLFSHDPAYAGTADLIGEYTKLDGSRATAVIDLKTGKRIGRYFAAQLAAYYFASEIVIGTIPGPINPVDDAIVLHVVNGTATFYYVDVTRGWADFAACHRIYEHSQKEGGLQVAELRPKREVI